jgi:hypothetical protein
MELRGNTTSILAMQPTDLTRFVMNVLLDLKEPTIVVIPAKNWRNFNVWPQLRNRDLSAQSQVLNFNNVSDTCVEEIIPRSDPRLKNLLAVVRVRADDETLQYLTNTLGDFKQIAGFIDLPNEDLMHFFSIGKELKNAKKQNTPKARFAPMTEGGAGISYGMPQAVEFVPFLFDQITTRLMERNGCAGFFIICVYHPHGRWVILFIHIQCILQWIW